MPGRRIPYCAPSIGQEEIDEVVDSLRNCWLTTGPKVRIFEDKFAGFVGVKHAIAVNSCTSALTLALAALNIGAGDEVILPTLTFCAAANVIEHRGAKPVLVDVGEDFQVEAKAVERAITPKTRAIMPVHYGGQACDLEAILDLAKHYGIATIQDAAHAAGAEYKGHKIGALGLVTAFSFYPSKNMTTGEGGMLTTDDDALANRLRRLSQFGIVRGTTGASAAWLYEVCEPGYKANMMDLQAAIGIQQLRKLEGFIARRRDIAARYSAAFADLEELILPADLPARPHAYYLYPVRVAGGESDLTRDKLIGELDRAGVGTSVHFVPLHHHSFYKCRFGESDFPVADTLYSQMVSLPLFPAMSEQDVLDVISAVREIVLDSRSKWNPTPERLPVDSQ